MTDSLSKRFISSIFFNLLRAGITFATGILLARLLGPDEYGRMIFLISSFLAFKQLIDMATESAFFTFISQRKRSRKFVVYFWGWVGLRGVLSLVLVGFILPTEVISTVWHGESRSLVTLALMASFFQNIVWGVASQLAEAQRETVRVQRLNAVISFMHLVVVIALWSMGVLAIPFLFVALIVEWSIGGWIAARMYSFEPRSDEEDGNVDTLSSMCGEFWSYCSPFIPYSLLGFAYTFGDRWMLQNWGGATEQANYGVAERFAQVVLIFTASVVKIFWKEIAEANENNDRKKLKLLYERSTRMLYVLGVFLCGGVIFWTKEIIHFFLGKAYQNALIPLTLMFIYPVHQSLGQISGTMLYATGKTKIQSVIGIVFIIVSMVVAYIMMAPPDALIPGFNLASTGLAWKMVGLQIVQVNVVAWSISRQFNWKFDWSYQVISVVAFFSWAYLSKVTIDLFLGDAAILLRIISFSIQYVGVILVIVYVFPSLAGVDKQKIWNLQSHFRRNYL